MAFDIESLMENVTEEEAQELLETEFPAELEKQAEAEVEHMALQDALFAYGALMADAEAHTDADGEIEKTAAEGFQQAEAEISVAIERGVVNLGLDQPESDQELHKHAMAAAGVILEGYAAQLEKIAANEPGGKDFPKPGTTPSKKGPRAQARA